MSEKREKLCLTVVSVQEKSDIELKKKKKKKPVWPDCRGLSIRPRNSYFILYTLGSQSRLGKQGDLGEALTPRPGPSLLHPVYIKAAVREPRSPTFSQGSLLQIHSCSRKGHGN